MRNTTKCSQRLNKNSAQYFNFLHDFEKNHLCIREQFYDFSSNTQLFIKLLFCSQTTNNVQNEYLNTFNF